MDGYTPISRPRSRKAHLGLSVKEYTKVAGTIASVRQSRQQQHPHLNGIHDNRDRSTGDEPSFIAETSFVKAPLNSRVSSISKGKGKQHDSLDRVPLDVQQALVLEDLLYVLTGIEGTYITYSPEYSPEDDDPLQGIKFVVAPSLDKSIRDLVERVLPLGTYYTSISAFIELRSHLDLGLVNHALCAAVRDMLKDYQTLLSQLEHAFNTSSTFSLQKLWFYVHPTVHTLSLIHNLVLELASYNSPSSLSSDDDDEEGDRSPSPSTSDAEEEARNEALGLGGAKLKALQSEFEGSSRKRRKKNGSPSGPVDDDDTALIPVKGGEVLAVLYSRMQTHSGDPTARALYSSLLRSAGRPYVEMVKGWVGSGRLEDRYDEFLVKERKDVDRKLLETDYVDEYWENRYTVRDSLLSIFYSKLILIDSFEMVQHTQTAVVNHISNKLASHLLAH
jgi:gamma-tubulin complex component 2